MNLKYKNQIFYFFVSCNKFENKNSYFIVQFSKYKYIQLHTKEMYVIVLI